MTNEKSCMYCNTKLTHKRRDARYCNPAHRAAQWRIKQQRPVSIKLIVPKTEYMKIKAEADMSGLMVNAFMLSKVIINQGVTV